MHRPTDVARWYRRIDPSCYTSVAPATSSSGADRRSTIRRLAAAPIGLLTATIALFAHRA